MRRKFIAAVTSGVLALTVMAALPTHAEAVSIWLDLTPGDGERRDGCFAFQGRNRLKEGAGGVLAGRYGYVRLPEGRDL